MQSNNCLNTEICRTERMLAGPRNMSGIAETMIAQDVSKLMSLPQKLDLFADDYNSLYLSQEPQEKQIVDFMEQLDLPVVSEDHRESMDKEFTLEELGRVISKMKLGKSPGLDGFPIEFYKVFKKELLLYLQELFSYCINQGVIPLSWSEAKIAVIPKSGKDSSHPEAYRPISILNVDYNILTSLWANRLSRFIGSYVSSEDIRKTMSEKFVI